MNNFNGNWNGNNNGWGGYPNNNPQQQFAQPGQQQMQRPMNQQGYYQQQPQQQMDWQQQPQQPMVNQQQTPGFSEFRYPTDQNEIVYIKVLEGILVNGLSNAKDNKNKSYVCTMRGHDFGINIVLDFDLEYRHLQPFVQPISRISINSPFGFGQEIDEKFLSQASFLGPQLAAIKDNFGNGGATIKTIMGYMDSLSNYIDAVGSYIDSYIARNQQGQIIKSPALDRALKQVYRFGGINITPVINTQPQQVRDQWGRVTTMNVATISFIYSLSENVTLNLKRDVSFMGQ